MRFVKCTLRIGTFVRRCFGPTQTFQSVLPTGPKHAADFRRGSVKRNLPPRPYCLFCSRWKISRCVTFLFRTPLETVSESYTGVENTRAHPLGADLHYNSNTRRSPLADSRAITRACYYYYYYCRRLFIIIIVTGSTARSPHYAVTAEYKLLCPTDERPVTVITII